MKKMFRRIAICGMSAAICWSVFLISDKKQLSEGLIRFHVVAHSDSQKDQDVKIRVRDAVLQSIQKDLQKIADIQEAKKYLVDNLPKIQQIVRQTLDDLDFHENACVTLCRERFDVRHYDTFSLPSGVYDSLRIVIGDGLGKNWWCVSFPSLCIPATTSGLADAAVEAGFSDSLIQTISGNETYEIRFFFLDQLGKLENILFKG